MASVLQVLVAASLLVFLPSAVPQRTDSRPPEPPRTPAGYPNATYDFFILSQQWSTGVCADNPKCVESSKKDYWTIHGLWPSGNGTSPAFCADVDFNVTDLDPIKADLNKYWPALTSKKERYFTFWRYQWEKHGSCAIDVPELNGTLEYFNSTLRLYKEYNIFKLLFNELIQPSLFRTYSDGDIRNALPEDMRGNVNIVCKRTTLPIQSLQGRTVSVLTEIHICLNKTLEPVNCTQEYRRCGRHNYYLPART